MHKLTLPIIPLALGCVAPDMSLFTSDDRVRSDGGGVGQSDLADCSHCKAALDLAFGDAGSVDPAPIVSSLCTDSSTRSYEAWLRISACACGRPEGPPPMCIECADWCIGQRKTPVVWVVPSALCKACVYGGPGPGCVGAMQLCNQDDGVPGPGVP